MQSPTIGMFKMGTEAHKLDTQKFRLNCKERVSSIKPTTEDWLSVINKIDHYSSEYKLFVGLLEKQKPVVVKVGVVVKLKKEYDFGEKLQSLKLHTFIKFYCNFTCNDNIMSLNNARSFCNGPGDSMGLLIMANYKLGRIDMYKWTKETLPILKNVMKHVLCSLICAYVNMGFIHSDTHLGNILLKSTKRINIEYGDFVLPISDGIIPVIMDFDRSFIVDRNTEQHLRAMYRDLHRFVYLLGSDLPKIKFDTSTISGYLQNLARDESPLPENFYKAVCEKVDTMSFVYSV